ncbi:hypothetical protein [uncultured Croceicoccus sp.]|uniref:hypothetical protein n=1 Tax=uncultured Croceicoccus sp. TaxID=1295329 RepID=UPI0026040A56|nr:hypothetical protein [uncultured Croceicoccus sp.]
MLATFFEWRIRPGRETQFRDGWDAMTRLLLKKNSHGSALFTNEAGHFCAFARWPDRAARDAAFAALAGTEIAAGPYDAMRDAIEREVQRMDLDLVSDLWCPPAPDPVNGRTP